MKKLCLLFAVLVLVSFTSKAANIISLTKGGKGLFGYADVSWHMGQIAGTSQQGWIGVCTGAGLIGCHPPGIHPGIDANDYETVKNLIDFAEDEIASSNFSGSSQMTIQVASELIERVYTVTWDCDAKGDGTISIDRTDGNN